MLRLAQPDDSTTPRPINSRRMGMLVLWLLGGSYRDIAHIHSIAHQTVIDYLNKMMTKEQRNQARFQTKLSFETLMIYHRWLREHPEVFNSNDPIAIARDMLANVSVED
jgi:hypothetical protein